MKTIVLLVVGLLAGTPAYAQTATPVVPGAITTSGCPSVNLTPCFIQNSSANPLFVTESGGGSTTTANQGTPNAGGTNSWPVQGAGAAGSAVVGNPVLVGGSDGTNARAIATDSSGHAIVVGTGTFATQAATSPAARTLITLDVKTVTTGGTAVNAISAGHRTAGGFLANPIGATVALCVNEIGTASGTTSSGDTTCIQPGQSYTVSPAATAVSVITSDSSHPFSGYGRN